MIVIDIFPHVVGNMYIVTLCLVIMSNAYFCLNTNYTIYFRQPSVTMLPHISSESSRPLLNRLIMM